MTWVLAVGAILVGLRVLPTWPVRDAVVVRLPAWDIPARIVVATLLVLGISAAAPIVGGERAGLIATFPVYASVLATFSHRLVGPAGAVEVLRGLLIGLPGFASFCLVAGAALDGGIPILASLGAAVTVALVDPVGHVPRDGRARQAGLGASLRPSFASAATSARVRPRATRRGRAASGPSASACAGRRIGGMVLRARSAIHAAVASSMTLGASTMRWTSPASRRSGSPPRCDGRAAARPDACR